MKCRCGPLLLLLFHTLVQHGKQISRKIYNIRDAKGVRRDIVNKWHYGCTTQVTIETLKKKILLQEYRKVTNKLLQPTNLAKTP